MIPQTLCIDWWQKLQKLSVATSDAFRQYCWQQQGGFIIILILFSFWMSSQGYYYLYKKNFFGFYFVDEGQRFSFDADAVVVCWCRRRRCCCCCCCCCWFFVWLLLLGNFWLTDRRSVSLWRTTDRQLDFFLTKGRDKIINKTITIATVTTRNTLRGLLSITIPIYNKQRQKQH